MTEQHESESPEFADSGRLITMDREEAPPAASVGEPALSLEPPPIIARSEQAFRRDLEQLLNEHPGKWVAYHNGEQIALTRTDKKLRAKCRKILGDCDEVLICHVDSGAANKDCEVLSSL
ncbi:MAG: hypothetical protein IH899_06190 [Planctomycetes bacterium]|nr:hypothetical protein [Planctomycetota bacterium]